MLYFFKMGTKPAQAFDVNLEGLVADDAISDYHYQKMAERHAKFLNELSAEPVKFYPKGKPQNTVLITCKEEPETPEMNNGQVMQSEQ